MTNQEDRKFEVRFERRLRKTNRTTVLSIPKVWLAGNNLSNGDRVLLTILDDGSLKVGVIKNDV